MSFSTPSIGNDIFAHHGRQIIARFLNDRADSDIPNAPIFRGHPETQLRLGRSDDSVRQAKGVFRDVLKGTSSSTREPTAPKDPVGILGAGVAGLYTALILLDLGIPFKVIEARERVGGRLFTHTFPNPTGAPYNYFDVGAMRFPEIESMRRVFHLFDYAPLNRGDLALKKKLKPFYFSNENTLLSYNGVTVRQGDQLSDTFKSDAVIQDVNPAPYVAAGAKNIADDVIEPFAKRLLYDLEHDTSTGWEFMKSFDLYSTRAYMNIQYRPSARLNIPDKPLPVDVVNWVETFDKSTGWYDRALSETVLEAVAFGWNPSTSPAEQTRWWCIDGGSIQIADTMYRYLKSRPSNSFAFSKRVTGIKAAKNSSGATIGIDVTTDHYETERFSHVISSIPLPVLRTIDLSQADLTPMQSNALRQLNYGPSVKIGMQFRTAWWTTGRDKDGRRLNIVGGQTYTDTPLRTVVYPSFGNVQAGKTTTLIASYCWTEDAERLAALISNDQQVLEEMTLRELAQIHNVTIEFLRGQLIDTFAWSWSQDPFTMGAFAFFGPGKFDNVYTSLTNPAASGRFHFAGEAISVRHAWVEGALDSAWRAVHELLLQEKAYQPYMKKFFQNWGVNAEWFSESASKDRGAPKGSPVLTVPRGRFEVPSGARGSGKEDLDVDRLLQSSLLVKHIALTKVGYADE